LGGEEEEEEVVEEVEEERGKADAPVLVVDSVLEMNSLAATAVLQEEGEEMGEMGADSEEMDQEVEEMEEKMGEVVKEVEEMEEIGEVEEMGEVVEEEVEMLEDCPLPGRRLRTASAGLSVLQHCSAVVGMHPDQAAEAIVDFAIAQRKVS
jgi:DNA repair exonuclease SbcCD ATPase subunit